MLSVCVCGWYLAEFDGLYRALFKAHAFRGIPVHVVANKPAVYLDVAGLPYSLRPNAGLEFGAYDHYLKHIWDGESDVVFMHDDVDLLPFVKDGAVRPPEESWDVFVDPGYDQAYVFRDRAEDVVNDGKHGRMLFMSARLLEFFREKGGIPFDEANEGYTSGKRPEGVKPYNYAVMHYDFLLDEAKGRGMSVRQPVYLPRFAASHRGVRGTMCLEGGKIVVKA